MPAPVVPTSSSAVAFFAKVLVFTSLLSAAYAAPVIRRQNIDSSCAKWHVIATEPYEVQSNLWGVNQATSGSQCTVSVVYQI